VVLIVGTGRGCFHDIPTVERCGMSGRCLGHLVDQGYMYGAKHLVTATFVQAPNQPEAEKILNN